MVILNGKKEAILMGSRIDKDISKELRAAQNNVHEVWQGSLQTSWSRLQDRAFVFM